MDILIYKGSKFEETLHFRGALTLELEIALKFLIYDMTILMHTQTPTQKLMTIEIPICATCNAETS